MSALAPSWAMGAIALDSIGDPHVPDGVHVRVFSAGEIGLPVAPFVVYRVSDDQLRESIAGTTRQEIAWTDSRWRMLTLPFAVTPDNPVTGVFLRGPGEVAIAATVQGLDDRVPSTHVREPVAALRGLTMHAFIDTPNGRQVVGTRSVAPHLVSAPRIDGITLQGTGTIRAAAWIMARAPVVRRLKPSFFMDLPIPAAARYIGIADAEQRAKDRVHRGAPARFGLHDDVTAAVPAAAPAATSADELTRVLPLGDELMPYLKAALDDTSVNPEDVRRSATLTTGIAAGAAMRDAELVCQSAVLAATADPGVARWLGFLETDAAAPATPIVVYFVRGFFAIDPARLPLALAAQLPAAARLTAPEPVPGLAQPVPPLSTDGRTVYDFVVPVFLFRGAASPSPTAPDIGAPVPPLELFGPTGTQPLQTGDALGTWVADVVPPAALRSLTLPVTSLSAACTLAFARREGAGPLQRLNSVHPVTQRAYSIIPARTETMGTGSGLLTDGEAPPGVVSYRIAQADYWGRWSDWNEQIVPAKPRTPPPAPVFTVHYTMADADPVNDTPRFGTLIARVTVPRADDLEAGSRTLTRIDVSGVINGVPVTGAAPLPAPGVKFVEVPITPPAGIIARGASVIARLNARWFDGTEHGPYGTEQQVVCADPRPPAALVIDPTLRYSSRPDAVGRSRIVLTWTGTASRRYRVYNSDETRLKAVLRERAPAEPAAAALLDAVNAATDINVRAEVWRTAPAALLTRDLFTNLTPEPLAGGAIRYQYDLSASLQVLSFFRIVPLTLENVEGTFTDAVLLPVAVPSGGPPPRPLLDFVGFTTTGEAEFTVTIVRGPQPAVRWRLRRSVADSDALRMPIVAEGDVPAVASGGGSATDGPIVFPVFDDGTDRFAGGSLPAWTRMSWRVEVQAPSPPGSTAPGEWSPASGVAGAMRVPNPPAPPTALQLTADGAGVALSWMHADTLPRGAQGGYRFEIYQRELGARELRTHVVFAEDPQHLQTAGGTRTWRIPGVTAPVGTSWRIVTIDPAGRVSAPSTLVTRS